MKRFVMVSFILVSGLLLLAGAASADTILYDFTDSNQPFIFNNTAGTLPEYIGTEAAKLYARVTLTDQYAFRDDDPDDPFLPDPGWYPIYEYEYYFENTGMAPIGEDGNGDPILSAVGQVDFLVAAPLQTVTAPDDVSFIPTTITDPTDLSYGTVLSFIFDPGIGGGETSPISPIFGFTSIWGPTLIDADHPFYPYNIMYDSSGQAQGTLYSDWVGPVPDENYFGDPVPEPGTLILVGTGLLGLAGFRRWRKKRV